MILIISPKNTYAAQRILIEAKSRNIQVKVVSVGELAKLGFKVNVGEFESLHIRNPYHKGSPKYLPHIISLAKQFKRAGKKVVDENIADGRLGEGKWKDYLGLKKAKISIPKTSQYTPKPYLLKPRPYILKWIYGMKGNATFLIKQESDLKKIPKIMPEQELMRQEFIEADYEYKVVCVGYKALPVVLKFKMNKLYRPDFKNYKVIKSSVAKGAVAIAENASKILGRELSKVDILEKDGKFYVLEVNRFPGLKSFEELTGVNVFQQFLRYLSRTNN